MSEKRRKNIFKLQYFKQQYLNETNLVEFNFN